MAEVRDSGRECQAATAQERLRGATPPPRSGAMARRRYPIPEARDGGRGSHPEPKAKGGCQEEQPHAPGQGQRPGGSTPPPRSRGCLGTGGPRGAIPH